MRTTICVPRRRVEQRAIESGVVADVLTQQFAAVGFRQQRAAMEGIDDERVAAQRCAGMRSGHRRAQQKVPGEIDPGDAQPGAAGDLEVDDREADRDAGAARQHFVEEAVARIVVALAVAGEAELVVEELVEGAKGVFRRLAARPQARRCRIAHLVEQREVGRRIEPGILDPSDRERRRRKLVARRVHRLLELRRDLDCPRMKMERDAHGEIVRLTGQQGETSVRGAELQFRLATGCCQSWSSGLRTDGAIRRSTRSAPA